MKNKKRLLGVLVVLTVLLAVLLFRVGYWALVQSEWLQNKSETQLTEDLAIAADRGTIFDRSGSIFVQSASANTVVIRPGEVSDAYQVSSTLSEILNMDQSYVYEIATNTDKYEIWLKRQITKEQSDAIENLHLDGVDFVDDVKRYYPNSELACQVLGLTTADGVGQSGIEKSYDKYLSGKEGRIIAETDKSGRQLINGNELYIDSTDGLDVVLSIDSVMQNILETACEDAFSNTNAETVEGIVLDPKTGQILAMTNIEGYDLNDPPRQDSDLMTKILKNGCISNTYAPNNLFEIFTMSSALDCGVINKDTRYSCNGFTVIDGIKYDCSEGHEVSSQTLEQILEKSCSSFFVNMVHEIGTEKYYDYLSSFCIGQKTGIDLPSESSGMLLKEKYVNAAQLADISNGREMAMTPLQLVCATAAVLNGGYYYTPYLGLQLKNDDEIEKEFGPVMKSQVISESTSDTMRDILQNVAKYYNNNVRVGEYTLGGLAGVMNKYDGGNYLDNYCVGAYIGFAPVENPEYISLICIDNPQVENKYCREVAVPYVNKVLEEILKYKNIPTSEDNAEYVNVPDVCGLDSEEARERIEDAGLKVELVGDGNVISQMPSVDNLAEIGSAVVLYCESNIKEKIEQPSEDISEVPDVTGMTVKIARDTIEKAGYKFDARGSGLAYKQMPLANEKAEKGCKVTVYFEPDLS